MHACSSDYSSLLRKMECVCQHMCMNMKEARLVQLPAAMPTWAVHPSEHESHVLSHSLQGFFSACMDCELPMN
jgi:hypothetical protein